MTHLTRDQILSRKVGHGTATLPDGSTVAIRALTRDETLHVNDLTGTARSDYIVATGVTDPVLTEEDVAAWGAQGAAGDLTIISEEISRISGLVEGAGKSRVARTGRRP